MSFTLSTYRGKASAVADHDFVVSPAPNPLPERALDVFGSVQATVRYLAEVIGGDRDVVVSVSGHLSDAPASPQPGDVVYVSIGVVDSPPAAVVEQTVADLAPAPDPVPDEQAQEPVAEAPPVDVVPDPAAEERVPDEVVSEALALEQADSQPLVTAEQPIDQEVASQLVAVEPDPPTDAAVSWA